MKRTLSGQIKPPSTSSKTMSPPISSTTQAPNAFKDKLTTVVTVTTRGAPHKEAKQVTLHKGMLPAKSPFLARACRDRDEVKLLDVDSEAFGVFAVWFYSGAVEFDLGGDGLDDGDILTSLTNLYHLSLLLESPGLTNALFTKACTVAEDHGLVFHNAAINTIYAHSAKSTCPLRRWIVDEWVWQFDTECVGDLVWEENKNLSKEFLFEVMKAQASRLGQKSRKHESPNARPQRYLHSFVPD